MSNKTRAIEALKVFIEDVKSKMPEDQRSQADALVQKAEQIPSSEYDDGGKAITPFIRGSLTGTAMTKLQIGGDIARKISAY